PQFSCVPLRSTSENCAVLPCFSDFGCFQTAHFLTFPIRVLWVFLPILGGAVIGLSIPGLLLFLPAPVCWLGSMTIEKVFRLHMQPEDLEKESGDKKTQETRQ
ncbi:hypothetical protein ACTQ33_16985, partial [Candidatus Avoscillospira sp. LCP25S3_F1]|uniref:hypothetical protein n=1 Tax=Candidatus Avoscillospira sp. LCP25S3_F1 TaxID=3438825 RepID=UPI003F93E7AF